MLWPAVAICACAANIACTLMFIRMEVLMTVSVMSGSERWNSESQDVEAVANPHHAKAALELQELMR